MQSSPYDAPRQPPFRPSMIGPLELVTAATGQVLTTAEAKAHLRVDITEDDTLIDNLIREATRLCEEETLGSRQFLTATFDLPVAQWWWDTPLTIPRPPLASVASVKYYDPAGVQQTLSTDYYEVRTPWRMPGWIARKANQTFPAHQCDRPYPITVRFDCGYGTAEFVPDLAKAAIKMVIHDRYNLRGATSVAWSRATALPFGVEAMLQGLGSGGYA